MILDELWMNFFFSSKGFPLHVAQVPWTQLRPQEDREETEEAETGTCKGP